MREHTLKTAIIISSTSKTDIRSGLIKSISAAHSSNSHLLHLIGDFLPQVDIFFSGGACCANTIPFSYSRIARALSIITIPWSSSGFFAGPVTLTTTFNIAGFTWFNDFYSANPPKPSTNSQHANRLCIVNVAQTVTPIGPL